MEFLAPWHPKVVHYPIALLTLYPIIIAAYILTSKNFFNKVSLMLLIIGVISSIAALLTGNAAAGVDISAAITDIKPVLDDHIFYANAVVWFFSFLLLVHLRYFISVEILKSNQSSVKLYPYILLLGGLLGLIFVQQVGRFGGKMVYEHGIGVKPERLLPNTTIPK